MMKCPCQSEKDYDECCAPFHRSERKAETPLALMRSRFAAYALGLPDYIIATTHPQNPYFHPDKEVWKKEIHSFSSHTEFIDLKILEAKGDRVKFHAVLKSDGRDVSFTEDSLFTKEDDHWLYKEGEIIP